MKSLAGEISRLPVETAWLDGEVVVLGDDGLPQFNALQNAFNGGGTDHIVYFVFDVMFLDGKDLRDRAFGERGAVLERLFDDQEQGRVRLSQTFATDGTGVIQSACKMGLEGVIAKRLNAPYRSTRSDAWQKVKCQLRQEFVVGGFTLRGGAGREIGSLLLGVYHQDGGLRSAGSVGTGWDAATAEAILRQLEKLESTVSPFACDYAPTKGRWSKRAKGSERWVKPKAVAEVSVVEWTPDGSIRHPVFRGMRQDKAAKAIRRETPVPVEVQQRAPARAVKVSNPGRVIDASSGLRKIDLVRYYESVGSAQARGRGGSPWRSSWPTRPACGSVT